MTLIFVENERRFTYTSLRTKSHKRRPENEVDVRWQTFRAFFSINILFIILTGCGTAQNHRQSTRSETEADTQAEFQDLAPAEGHYEGKMTILKSREVFDVVLDIKRVYQNERLNQGQDPTQTVNIPKLSGSMQFPLLQEIGMSDYSHYSDLIDPMGGFTMTMFDFGDYEPNTHLLVLPYTVSGYSQGSFGELQGHLENNKFTGTWFSKPLGTVGKFTMTISPLVT